MLKFKEDRTHTYQKGEKELVKVVMYYKDGTTQEITDVEPTMVLVGWEYFNKLKTGYEYLASELVKLLGLEEEK